MKTVLLLILDWLAELLRFAFRVVAHVLIAAGVLLVFVAFGVVRLIPPIGVFRRYL
jgi:hypothetical protein